jgi:caffeoyl-CoA O-methyltransferase
MIADDPELITNPAIEKYLLDLLPARDPVLSEMEAFAASERIPIIGPAVGTLLSLFVKLSGAKRIFELGSAIGYSTIWLARAAGPGAEIHYSDSSERHAELARGFFEQAGVSDRIHMHVADALEALAATPGEFDMIFNDVDKEGYPGVLDAVPLRIRRGGLFITDNTLWHARVLNPKKPADLAVVEFNARLAKSEHFRISSVLPLRDGVTISVRA